jgi:hypothetical protein
LRHDWEEVSSKGEEEHHAREISEMIIAGKIYEAFQTTKKETICEFAGWSHVLLYCEIGGGSTNSLIRAVKL